MTDGVPGQAREQLARRLGAHGVVRHDPVKRGEREVPADGVDVYRVRIRGDRLQPRAGFADVAGPLAPGGDHDHQHIAE
jgi:hypothetical protein